MPYTPPHKRLSGDAKTPTRSSPAADSLADRFSNSLRFGRNRRPHSFPGGKVNYAPGSTSLWWPIGSRDGDEPIPASFRLERVPGAKHLVLCRNPLSGGTGSGGLDETPWETIAERIEPHLFACVQRAMEAKTTAAEGEEVKLSFLARVGKVHFKEGTTLDSLRFGRNRRPHSFPGGKVNYAPGSTSLWWPIGSRDGDEPIPASFRLERVPGAKHLVLCRNPLSGGTGSGGLDETPWETIAERIEPHLFACVQKAMEAKTTAAEGEEVKLSFLARVGKVHFREGTTLDSIRKAAVAEANWNTVHKSFNTDVSDAYMEDIQHKVVPKTELGFESAKELYHVKVYDKSRPGSTISCKCTVGDGGELKIHKMELNHVRHLLVDISCLYKDTDFRLMLVNKTRLTSPDDEEKDAINKLIKSAILDPAVKCGLRWPRGKDYVADRFNVVGVWHAEYKAFRAPSMRLKLRHVDRFDYQTSTGEVNNEVTLKLPGISQKLRDADLDRGSLMEMVEESVKLIWDHFLCRSNDMS